MKKKAETILLNYELVKEGRLKDHLINSMIAANALVTPLTPSILAGQHLSSKYGLHESPMIKESPLAKGIVNTAVGSAGTGGLAPIAGAGATVAGHSGLRKLKRKLK